MQMFSSYFLCVKFLLVVIVCAQDEIVTNNLDTTTTNLATAATESSTTTNTNDLQNSDTTVLPAPVVLETESSSTSTIEPSSSDNLNISDSTTVPSTTLLSSTDGYHTSTTNENSNTIIIFTVDTNTTASNGSTTTENSTSANTTYTSTTTGDITTTTQIPHITTTEEPLTTTEKPLTTTEKPLTTTEKPLTTTEEPCQPPDSVNITVIEILKTRLNLSIVVLSNGTVCPTLITITCNASNLNNTMWPWVIPTQFAVALLNDTEPHGLTISNLSEFTNYTCSLRTNNSSFADLLVQTKQAVPSSPGNLDVNILNPTSFIITWTEPTKIPSILEGYRITITREKVASTGHIWNNCTDVDTYTKNLTDTSLVFKKALADFVYNVSVIAVSSVGYSKPTRNVTITPIAASDSPKNITFNLTEEEMYYKDVVMTQRITWKPPCNTNGPVHYFQIELSGYYLYNTSIKDFYSPTVPVIAHATTYSFNFSNVLAASNYTVKIYLIGDVPGSVYSSTFITDDNYASAPELETTNITSQDFLLTWNEPANDPGNIENYVVYVAGEGINWNQTEHCNVSNAEYNRTEFAQIPEFYTDKVAPDATYSISVAAQTSRGRGNWTNYSVTTRMSTPILHSVSYQINSFSNTEVYDDNVTITFPIGCLYGGFDSSVVDFTGIRMGYEDHSNDTLITDYDINEYTFDLKPEYSYIVNVTIKNRKYDATGSINFTAPAGVPVIDKSTAYTIPVTPGDTQTTLVLKYEYFDASQGSLRYLAVIVSDENITGGSFSRWEQNSEWPTPEANTTVYYQATPKYWNPFSESGTSEFVLGNDTSCSDDQYCNKPLKPGTQYYVFIRLFNENFYRNTMPISFVTKDVGKLGVILGAIFGILAMSVAGFVAFILWRKGYIGIRRRRPETPGSQTEIPIRKFVAYCKHLEQNPNVLKAQWTELEEQSNLLYSGLTHHFATLPENKRKNRFTNILPFDHSRVKLNIDEDDEICSDYINASYIKGFSNENEYIATQGPLSGTCRDFWKMILQEGVSIIVMVSQFIENNRDKCYKYFPNNRETMTITGDDIEVRCSTELHFGYYRIRRLQVKKELKQVTVTHLQFLEWPDFGVPSGPESMLNFCHQLRERWSSERGLIVVHCSAGVGRTGTIIATDILLRALKAGRRIDVFNTVLELRRQRKSMVQTEKQYMYIHQLIRSMIEFPIGDEQDNPEHLYENVQVRTRNGIVESSF